MLKVRFLLVALIVALMVVGAVPALAQDADGDGVLDGADLCAGTPIGSSVGVDGCPTPATFASALTEVTGLFNGLSIEAVIAMGAVIGGVGLLARRVVRAAR